MILLAGGIVREYSEGARKPNVEELSLMAKELLEFRQRERLTGGWPPSWSIDANEQKELPGHELTGSALIGG